MDDRRFNGDMTNVIVKRALIDTGFMLECDSIDYKLYVMCQEYIAIDGKETPVDVYETLVKRLEEKMKKYIQDIVFTQGIYNQQ